MSLIVPAAAGDIRTDQPGTHVLVIGVGGYPHIGDGAGAGADPEVRRLLRSLRPLESPPRSALAVARYFAEEYRHPVAPLQSLRVLVSPHPSDPLPWPDGWPQAAAATRANIKAAYRAWRDCGTHKDSILIFYFCGHGFEKSQHVLLCEELGAEPDSLPDAGFDIGITRWGTANVGARTQLWLIDACRDASREVLAQIGHSSPLAGGTTQRQTGLDSTLIASATPFAKAGGPPRQPSRFAAALLEALRGGAVDRDRTTGRWEIRTIALVPAINACLRRQEREHPGWQEQRCEPRGGTGEGLLALFDDDVPTVITCEPADRLRSVELYVRSLDVDHRRPPGPKPLAITLPAGVYRIGAEPGDGRSPEVPRDVDIRPPVAEEVLRW